MNVQNICFPNRQRTIYFIEIELPGNRAFKMYLSLAWKCAWSLCNNGPHLSL